jgi:hypothetical protein
MAEANSQNFDTDLSVAKTTQIPGPSGNVILGVYPVKPDATSDRIPAGAQVEIQFGNADPIFLEDAVLGFEFPCGHDRGIKVINHVALPNAILRLCVVYQSEKMT